MESAQDRAPRGQWWDAGRSPCTPTRAGVRETRPWARGIPGLRSSLWAWEAEEGVLVTRELAKDPENWRLQVVEGSGLCIPGPGTASQQLGEAGPQ